MLPSSGREISPLTSVAGGNRPVIAFSSVLFPDPEGPMMTTNSPAATSRSMAAMACVSRLGTP